MKRFVSVALVLFTSGGAVFAQGSGGDDFSSQTQSWKPDRSGSAGRFAVVNGRLEFTTAGTPTSNDSATRVWNTNAPYDKDWSVQVDVTVADYPAPPNGYASMELSVGNSADSSADLLRIKLRRGNTRYFQSDAFAKRKSLGAKSAQTASTSGALQLQYVASTHTLTASFDEDGAANGYTFVPSSSFDISSDSSNWGMTAADSFQVKLVAQTGNSEIASGDIYADNFVPSWIGVGAATLARVDDRKPQTPVARTTTSPVAANTPASPTTSVVPAAPVVPAVPAAPSAPVTSVAPMKTDAGAQSAEPERPMPVPTVSAKTGVASNRLVRTTQTTERTTQSLKSMSVDVNVSFFQPPPSPYEVQCFFVAKSDTTGQRFVFDATSRQSQERLLITTFVSQPLDGGSKTFTAIPFTGTVSGTTTNSRGFNSGTFNGTVSGVATSSSQTLGNKIEGWVVRVVSRGKVLRTESNQPGLKDVAAKMTAELDQAAAGIAKE